MFTERLGRWGLPPILAAVAVALIVVIQAWALGGSYQAEWKLETRSAENTLHTIAANIQRNLELIDLSLARLADAAMDPSVRTLPPAIRMKVLFDNSASARGFGAMLVVDADGKIVADSASDPPRVANLADRDYFKAQIEPGAGLFVSALFRSRLSNGVLSVALSRRLSYADGRFAGVVVATIRVAYFRSLFEGLTLGAGNSIAVLNTDGTLIYLYPTPQVEAKNSLGKVNAGPAAVKNAGEWVAGSPVTDGVRRYFFREKINGYPLFVLGEISYDDAMEGWYRQLTVSVIVVIFTLLIVVLTIRSLHVALIRSRDMEAKFERLSLTDALTHMPNRRACELVLSVEDRRAARSGQSVSVAMVDIDFFKRVNDRYGHKVGDQVIARVGAMIEATVCRPGDYAARYGGEEFLIILPLTDTDGALFVAERVRLAVEGLSLREVAPGLAGVTLSVGVATRRPDDAATIEQLVERADQALYQAKSRGRNRVVVHDRSDEPDPEQLMVG